MQTDKERIERLERIVERLAKAAAYQRPFYGATDNENHNHKARHIDSLLERDRSQR